jgi:hypothetical protein
MSPGPTHECEGQRGGGGGGGGGSRLHPKDECTPCVVGPWRLGTRIGMRGSGVANAPLHQRLLCDKHIRDILMVQSMMCCITVPHEASESPCVPHHVLTIVVYHIMPSMVLENHRDGGAQW